MLFAPGFLSDLATQDIVDSYPCAIQAKVPGVVVDRAPGWQIVGQHVPARPATYQVEDPVEHLAPVHLPLPATGFCRGMSGWISAYCLSVRSLG